MYVNVNVKEIMFIPVARRVKEYTKLVRIKNVIRITGRLQKLYSWDMQTPETWTLCKLVAWCCHAYLRPQTAQNC